MLSREDNLSIDGDLGKFREAAGSRIGLSCNLWCVCEEK